MIKINKSFRDYYFEKSLDYIGVLCTLGNHNEFNMAFSWSEENGFDVDIKNDSTKANGVWTWKTEIKEVTQNLWMWKTFTDVVQQEAKKIYGRRADELIHAELSGAYIYMRATKGLSRKSIRELQFLGVENRNNELHFMFESANKRIDVHFVGKLMDDYLNQIKIEAQKATEHTVT